MTNRSGSNVWDDFMTSEFVQDELTKIKKEAQQFSDGRDRDSLYNVDPDNKTELSKSTDTQGVNAGSASMAGSEDRTPLYTTSPAAVQGGAEQHADATVEGLEDTAAAMMAAATSEPTGAHIEEQGALKASGSSVKPFSKKAFGDDTTLEAILAEIEQEEGNSQVETNTASEHTLASSNKKETVAILKELVKIADQLDQDGQHADASEIDAVIKDEVTTLLATAKKK